MLLNFHLVSFTIISNGLSRSLANETGELVVGELYLQAGVAEVPVLLFVVGHPGKTELVDLQI
jgi:hypothetical protein